MKYLSVLVLKREVISINNKVLIKLVVPEIDNTYDLYLPVNKKIGNIINLLNATISDLTSEEFVKSNSNLLFNAKTGHQYSPDTLLLNTDIRNGTVLVLLSE